MQMNCYLSKETNDDASHWLATLLNVKVDCTINSIWLVKCGSRGEMCSRSKKKNMLLADCTLVGDDGALGCLGSDSKDDDGHAKDESAFEGDHDEIRDE